jgi:hypothetical protein
MTRSTLARLGLAAEHPDRKRGCRVNPPSLAVAPFAGCAMPDETPTWWTVAQAAVWIRTRDLAAVEKLEPREVQSLALANGVVPGVLEAADYLTVALGRGRFVARGRLALPLIDAKTGADAGYRMLDTDAAAIPQSFWSLEGGRFPVEIDRIIAKAPDDASLWIEITLDADLITGRWQTPAALLEGAPLLIGRALAELPNAGTSREMPGGLEDNPAWFLLHPDVIVTGLNAGGERVQIERGTLEDAFTVDMEANTLTAAGLHWPAVNVALADDGAVATVGHHPIMRAEPVKAPLAAATDADAMPAAEQADIKSTPPPAPQRPHTAKASQAAHDREYKKYRDECVVVGRSPNVNEDEPAGRVALGARFDREKWRNSRRQFKPEGWSSTGKRKARVI